MRIWIRMKTEQDTKETCLAVFTWKTEIYTSKWSFKGNDSIILTTIIQAQRKLFIASSNQSGVILKFMKSGRRGR